MIFTEARFLIFFALCFVVRWLLPTYRAQKLWLLACSCFFYGCWDYRFLGLIMFAACVDFVVAQALASHEKPLVRRAILLVSLVLNLGLLGFFKYYNFFVTSGVGFLHWMGFTVTPSTLEIVLPVGISFITFQTLSYTIDVYRRELEPSRDFFDFALFVAFFPQLVAGPIVRARDFLPQLDQAPRLSDVEGRRWLVLFLIGFFKKACLADNIAAAIDPVFADPASYFALDALLSSILYSVQIYCDFSGYSDMAIAVAGLLGYSLVTNFDFPYFSRSIQEFWRRWHMSLSTWLRDYLYVSLGGNRGSSFATYRNLMLTMILGGLWHGANFTFIVWGFLHGLALAMHRALTALRMRLDWKPLASRSLVASRVYGLLAWALTFAWVVLCFTIFRAPTLDAALLLLSRLGSGGPSQLNPDLWFLLVAIAAVHYLLFRGAARVLATIERAPDAAFYLLYGAACAMLPYFMQTNAQPFIYFQF